MTLPLCFFSVDFPKKKNEIIQCIELDGEEAAFCIEISTISISSHRNTIHAYTHVNFNALTQTRTHTHIHAFRCQNTHVFQMF